ncbi:GNAT family N-acetyltransferase [Polaribacter pectinis]|uniref:GNAT family N-acetyltransferase n=1 Tax=Polaribacter pectinis TaxID=2738844 RepID=A0A7G9L8I0_9FLAO|nr:GNAT family N-acetyltransferase [Polaribacter pectinis]QNM84929.1 GNAT family N-acetyltransferase [Polaribacter pectinis]
MITYTRTKSIIELKQILELQSKNLPNDLSSNEKKKEGFVTVQHTLDVLEKMHKVCPHTIAKFNNKVVGYAMSMTKDFAEEIDVLKPMFLEINNIISNENYIVMGQICVDKEHRKKGVFRSLYNFMKEEVAKDYKCIITEIDAENTRSLNAHKSVGFKHLKTYVSNKQNWVIVSLKC